MNEYTYVNMVTEEELVVFAYSEKEAREHAGLSKDWHMVMVEYPDWQGAIAW